MITEAQPTAFLDGKDTIGTQGGKTSNDKHFEIILPPATNGLNNNFGERYAPVPTPTPTQPPAAGCTSGGGAGCGRDHTGDDVGAFHQGLGPGRTGHHDQLGRHAVGDAQAHVVGQRECRDAAPAASHRERPCHASR